jgi:dipeptide/tripeptide permease
MPTFLTRILGLNASTTLAGIVALIAAIGRVALAWKARDFESVVTDGQLILSTILAIAVGLGFIKAKDKNVTGAGPAARLVDSSGTVTNREGETVGQQR